MLKIQWCSTLDDPRTRKIDYCRLALARMIIFLLLQDTTGNPRGSGHYTSKILIRCVPRGKRPFFNPNPNSWNPRLSAISVARSGRPKETSTRIEDFLPLHSTCLFLLAEYIRSRFLGSTRTTCHSNKENWSSEQKMIDPDWSGSRFSLANNLATACPALLESRFRNSSPRGMPRTASMLFRCPPSCEALPRESRRNQAFPQPKWLASYRMHKTTLLALI